MITKKERIIARAVEMIKDTPEGIRYSELGKICQEFPDISPNTIRNTICKLDLEAPNEVYKPARGLFRHTRFRGTEIEIPPTIEKIKEESFYEPFANWLVGLGECTKAIPLGGNRFKDKWGTPDVIGKRELLRSDVIKAPTEIVSAEIKTDTKDLITAFGQACSYKIFSHKSYLVIPKNSPEDDIARIDALSSIFGIGLILSDNTNVSDPQFEIRVRPTKHEPDMFYMNKYMKIIEKELFA
jgi:hypothetical protein